MSCRKCSIELTEENCHPSSFKYGINICIPCYQQEKKTKYEKGRKLLMSKFGNKCACCGITNYQVLSIDHIYGGGNKEKQTLRGAHFINKLVDMNEIELRNKYQCLCYNCNYCKGFYGRCAHEIM